MADLFTVITDKAVLDYSQVEDWSAGVIIAATEQANFLPGSPLISQTQRGNFSVGTFIKFAQNSASTSALTDGEEITSTAITDTEVNLTIAEYGHDITVTALGQNASGARAFAGASRIVGDNLASTIDTLAIQALEAGSNETIVTQLAETAITASDIITPAYVQRMYNKLRRAKQPKLLDGLYVAVVHPDVMYDLKAATAANSWTDVNKYNNEIPVLRNEVGIYGGFRWIESANVSVNANAGNVGVDTYHTLFLGYNSLGMAMSAQFPVRTYMNDTNSKIPGRFTHLGWHGLFTFGIVEQSAVQVLTSASTVGANT
ncbi:MAG: hypothetical protein FD143_3269 [Ignavibacteria bacterium]|nr:MAG: hypothetical protein FD143_3269 [Ignavibacteria bacterium]